MVIIIDEIMNQKYLSPTRCKKSSTEKKIEVGKLLNKFILKTIIFQNN